MSADDADLDWAVDTLMDGRCSMPASAAAASSASMCTRSLYDAFVEKAVAWVNRLKLGNPLDRKRRSARWPMCALRNEVRAQIARRWPMARWRTSIRPRPRRRWRGLSHAAGPHDVTHDMRVMRDESFGPVVGIMPVKDDEGVALMNDCQFGLTASLWTG
jgi:acyl-CoA reductase-like NAD-dependent aldehyde dehydrogenase